MGSAHSSMSSSEAIPAAVTARRKSSMESDSIWRQHTAAISPTLLIPWELLISICIIVEHISNGGTLYIYIGNSNMHGAKALE